MEALLLFIQMFIATYFGGVGEYKVVGRDKVEVVGVKADGTSGWAIIQGRNNPIILGGEYE